MSRSCSGCSLLELLGLIAFPLTFVALRGLADRGYGVAKMLGMLLLAWLSWIGPSLKIVPYQRWWIVLCLGLLIGVSAAVGMAAAGRAACASSASARALLLTEEAIFLVLFGLFLLIRIGNPDLWHPARGGEKPMEFAYPQRGDPLHHLPALRSVARGRVHQLLLLRVRHRRHADQADRHRAVGGLQPGHARRCLR